MDFGRNVTTYCDIMHVNQNKLVLPPNETGRSQGSISLFDRDMHTYIPHSAFTFRVTEMTSECGPILCCISALIDGNNANKP